MPNGAQTTILQAQLRLTCVDQNQFGIVLGFDHKLIFSCNRNTIAGAGFQAVDAHPAARDHVKVPFGVGIHLNRFAGFDRRSKYPCVGIDGQRPIFRVGVRLKLR